MVKLSKRYFPESPTLMGINEKAIFIYHTLDPFFALFTLVIIMFLECTMKEKWKMIVLGIIIIIVGIAIDQITKQIIIDNIKIIGTDSFGRPIPEPIVVIKDFFSITYAENTVGMEHI
jgi:lipoprotein signal peptidase